MSTTDTTRARAALQSQRARLIRQLHELGATESGDLRAEVEFGDGFADAGAATAERTEVLGLVESLRTQLDGVEAALARIEDGTYGSCSECGEEISQDRLEARPESILCVNCKTRR